MSARDDYWQEAFESTMDAMGLYHIVQGMTDAQRKEMGASLATSHENYGLAFYTPSTSDRISAIEREWKKKLDDAERQKNEYIDRTEKVLRRVLRQHHDTHLSIDKEGNVVRWGGRTEIIA